MSSLIPNSASKHTWLDIKGALLAWHQELPFELSESVIIGGTAALAYQALLEQNGIHLDSSTPDQWLTGDIDFVSQTDIRERIFDLKPEWIQINRFGRQMIQVKGVRLSYVPMPSTFDAEEAWNTAQVIDLIAGDRYVRLALLNPILLYREKQYLTQKGRGKANDSVHLLVAQTYTAFDLASRLHNYIKDPNHTSWQNLEKQLTLTQEKAPELFNEPLWKKEIQVVQSQAAEQKNILSKLNRFRNIGLSNDPLDME